jgi:hypothetical protein
MMPVSFYFVACAGNPLPAGSIVSCFSPPHPDDLAYYEALSRAHIAEYDPVPAMQPPQTYQKPRELPPYHATRHAASACALIKDGWDASARKRR